MTIRGSAVWGEISGTPHDQADIDLLTHLQDLLTAWLAYMDQGKFLRANAIEPGVEAVDPPGGYKMRTFFSGLTIGASPYTASDCEIIVADASFGDVIINLPAIDIEKFYAQSLIVSKIDSSANKVSLVPNDFGPDYILGAASYDLTSMNQTVLIHGVVGTTPGGGGDRPSWFLSGINGDVLKMDKVPAAGENNFAFFNDAGGVKDISIGLIDFQAKANMVTSVTPPFGTFAGLTVGGDLYDSGFSTADATDLTDGGVTTLHSHALPNHAANHTNGTDDVQSATAAQKGLATAAQITKLDGIEAGAQVNPTLSKSFIITAPTVAATASGPIWRVPVAITITAIHVLCVGGTSIIGQLWEYDTNGLNGAVVDASDITGLAGTNVNDDGALSNPGIAANNYLGWRTTTINGAPTKVIITFEYTED